MRFSFCPVCGNRLSNQKHDGETVPMCQNPSCGFIFWQNSKPCVTVLIADAQGRLLIGVRAKEPDKGKLDLPGGFLQEGEHPHDGAQREIKEELNIELKTFKYIGSYYGRYFYKGINYHTLCFAFAAKMPDKKVKTSDEISALKFFKKQEIPIDKIAFVEVKNALKNYLSSFK